jgi:hypothetical protein
VQHTRVVKERIHARRQEAGRRKGGTLRRPSRPPGRPHQAAKGVVRVMRIAVMRMVAEGKRTVGCRRRGAQARRQG